MIKISNENNTNFIFEYRGDRKMNLINKVLLVIWVLSLLVLAYFTGDYFFNRNDEMKAVNQSEVIQDELGEIDEPIEEPVVIPEVSMELAMIGDVLLHRRLAVYQEFTSSFEPVLEHLQSPDYLIANQESPPTAPTYPINGYPQFSSPEYIIRDLQKAGVDMVNIANNHIVDKGEGGMTEVFKTLDNYNMPYVGAYRSKEDASNARIIEKEDLKIGVLSYTYGTNGLYLPKGSEYIVNYIDVEKMVREVQELKPQVDVVTVLIHWGDEYTIEYNSTQKDIATRLNEVGADIIFGSHPHVLQPYEKIVGTAGNVTHVYYSLGNFFATIVTIPETFIGGIASVQITKKGEEVTIDTPKVFATSMLKDADGIYRIYPLAEVESRSIRNMEWVKNILGEDVIVY